MPTLPTSPAELPGQPNLADNQQDARGTVSGQTLAASVAEFHRRGLSRRKKRDLTAEKYLLHIDGEGDSQWLDLLQGERIAIPPNISGTPRSQHNLLRPMVDNQVAYHTTAQFQFVAEGKQDRDSRESALIDQAFANYLTKKQRLNAVFAEAMYLADGYGHCPVHAFWRDDLAADPYEPVFMQGDEREQLMAFLQEVGMELPTRGFIDCWVGDPWDSVYHAGAKRNSVQMWQYGRTLPADLVRRAFEREDLEGSNKLPSASRFQRIARKWLQSGREIHGSATIYAGEQTDEDELIALIYRETAAGIDPDYPDGWLSIVALQGSASTDREEAAGSAGSPVLLFDGALPAKRFSAENVYSMHRFDDVLGKPYVADLDDLQVELNQLKTLLKEYVRRSCRAPLLDTGILNLDEAFYEDDAILHIDEAALRLGANMLPRHLELPSRHVQLLETEIERVMETMFRIGGWQAASRGESRAGDPAAKVVALARADDTVHGPTNYQFRLAVERYMGLCWSLMKQYADVPWIIDITGDELAHLADAYIDRTKLSETVPNFKLVSGFGATPEAKTQQLMAMVQATGADGEPLITTAQFRRKLPDQSLYPDEQDPDDYRQRRPKVINAKLRRYAMQAVEQLQQGGQQLDQMPLRSPQLEWLAKQLLAGFDQQFPVLMDDDIEAHLLWLSTLTQDETEHPLVRQLAIQRQDLYWQWLAQQQAAAVAQQAEQAGAEAEATAKGKASAEVPAEETAGTTTSESMQAAQQEVPGLTREAEGATR
jgi:hypothetical protein